MTAKLVWLKAISVVVTSLGVMLLGGSVDAQDATADIARYREMLADGNPAELWEARGEGLWKESTGPKQTSLVSCDLGKGPGVVRGAYVEMPRYFGDVGQVMDVEQRLVHCMVTLQGLTAEEAMAQHFGDGAKQSKIEALVAYIASQSRGMPMSVRAAEPHESEMYEIGKSMFYFRAGAYDFSCATCHAGDGLRIRLQQLPNLTKESDSQKTYTTWPAYRLSQGEVRTMQHRIYDCFRQQRFPEVIYGSDIVTALELFMAKNAQGGIFDAPAIKR